MAGLIALNSKVIWALGLGMAGAVGGATFVKTESGQPIVAALVDNFRGVTSSEQPSKIDLMDKSAAIITKPADGRVKSTEETANIKPKTTEAITKETKTAEPKMVKPEMAKPEIKMSDEIEEVKKDVSDKPQTMAALEKPNANLKVVPTIVEEKNAPKDVVKKAATVDADTAPPTIDLLRVARDGYVVMAGRAAPNTNVLAYNGGKVIGKTKSTATGDYVFVLDEPLKIGEHELIVAAGNDKSKMVSSLTSGVVILPENKSETIVLLSKPGEASKILQMPNSKLGSRTANLKTDNKTENKSTGKNIKNAAELPIAINAVDVEEKRYYIAGAATPNSKVNVYIDNDLKGTAITGEEGAFLYYGRESITVGKHALRVDMLGLDNVTVVGRAEVVLDHESNQPKEIVIANKSEEKKTDDTSASNIEIAEVKDKIEAKKVAEIESPKEEMKNAGPVANAAISSGSTGKKIADIGDAIIKTPVDKMADAKMTASVSDTSAVSKANTIDGKKVIKSGSSVIIRRGDSLWKVSRRKFGNGSKYIIIYSANRDQVQNPHRIYPGQVLNVPDQEQASQ